MANRTRNILNALTRDKLQDKIIEDYNKKMIEAADYYEKQREKTEAQKTHERHRNNQKRHELAMDLTELIKPAKKNSAQARHLFLWSFKKTGRSIW